MRVLVQTNGELAEGKVVAGLVKEFDTQDQDVQCRSRPGKGRIPQSGWQWIQVSEKRAEKVFRIGHMVRMKLGKRQDKTSWVASLEQDSSMEGSLMTISPQTGRVICMVGGRNFEKSQFNRCTRAVSQPGSYFKPLIYSAALDKGYAEASVLIDSPISFDDNSARGPWSPRELRPKSSGVPYCSEKRSSIPETW